MSKKVVVYSGRDIKKMIDLEVDKRIFAIVRLLNKLHLKVIDLERIGK